MLNFSSPTRVAAVYGALFLPLGIYLPFFPLLLSARGLDDPQIAIVIAAPQAIRALAAAPLGSFADRLGDRRLVLIFYSLIAAIGFTLLGAWHGFGVMLALSIVALVPFNSCVPIAEAVAAAVTRSTGSDYGRMRMWGSVLFVLANIVFGAVIAATSAESVYWGLLITFWAAAAIMLLAPRMTVAPLSGDRRAGFGIGALLGDRILRFGMFAAAASQASHAMSYSFATIYWLGLGFSGTVIGIFWALGVVAEILMFAVSGRLFRGVTPGQMLALAGLAGTIRWCLFSHVASATGFFALQLLHAMTFACCHLAMMRLILLRVPDGVAATAQGLYTTVTGVALAIMTLGCGPLYRFLGGDAFATMSLLSACCVLLAVFGVGLRPIDQPQKAGSGRRTIDPS